MYAADFRARARDALRGHWGVAIAVGLVAVLLGGGYSGGGRSTASTATGNLSLDHQIYATVMTIVVVAGLLALVIGGVIEMGWADFNLKLLNRQEPRFGTLFGQFDRIGAGFCMVVLRGIFVFLWSLLFVIPGIIASYRYALMPYLMAEYEMGALDAMQESKRLMDGNKARLFCLDLSFIGWNLLGVLTFGIGLLWVNPYQQAARAAFYQEICREDGAKSQGQSGPDF